MVKKRRYKKVVYDLGCGPAAIDAISYARKHPEALVIAIDRGSVVLRKEDLPPNVRIVENTSYYSYKPRHKADLIMLNFPETGPKQLPKWALPYLKKGGKLEIRVESTPYPGIHGGVHDSKGARVQEFAEETRKRGFEVEVKKIRSPPAEFMKKSLSEVIGRGGSVPVGRTGAAGLAPRGYYKMIIRRPVDLVFRKIRKKKRVDRPRRKV